MPPASSGRTVPRAPSSIRTASPKAVTCRPLSSSRGEGGRPQTSLAQYRGRSETGPCTAGSRISLGRLSEALTRLTAETRRGARSGAGVWQESRGRYLRERLVKGVLTACPYLSVLTTFGIVGVLIF